MNEILVRALCKRGDNTDARKRGAEMLPILVRPNAVCVAYVGGRQRKGGKVTLLNDYLQNVIEMDVIKLLENIVN